MVGEFRKSSSCGDSACVEVARLHDVILVRSTTAPEKALTFTKEEWDAFLIGAKAGEFDIDSLQV